MEANCKFWLKVAQPTTRLQRAIQRHWAATKRACASEAASNQGAVPGSAPGCRPAPSPAPAALLALVGDQVRVVAHAQQVGLRGRAGGTPRLS